VRIGGIHQEGHHMLRKDEVRELLAYDAWADEGLTRVLERVADPDARIARVWAHVAAAGELWYARCSGADYAQVRVWPDTDVREASRRLALVHGRWAESARSWTDADLLRHVEFKNSRGEACADALGDIVRHLVNHGTHHRGQIAMLLRESGVAPANLDFIIYCRQRGQKIS
jgi:uncharacterized damage-inducible protein DinB